MREHAFRNQVVHNPGSVPSSCTALCHTLISSPTYIGSVAMGNFFRVGFCSPPRETARSVKKTRLGCRMHQWCSIGSDIRTQILACMYKCLRLFMRTSRPGKGFAMALCVRGDSIVLAVATLWRRVLRCYTWQQTVRDALLLVRMVYRRRALRHIRGKRATIDPEQCSEVRISALEFCGLYVHGAMPPLYTIQRTV